MTARYAPDPDPSPDSAHSLADIVRAARAVESRRIAWATLARTRPLAVDPGVLARRSSQGRTNAATDKAREARRRHANPVERREGGLDS